MGAGICFIERHKITLHKTLPYSYKGEVDLLSNPPQGIADNLAGILTKYSDILRRSTHIIANVAKPWIGPINIANIQPKVSTNRGHMFVLSHQGAVLNYKNLWAKAKTDSDALFNWLIEEHFEILPQIEGNVDIMFSYVSKNITPSVYVYSTNTNGLYHVYHRDVHFICSNKNLLYLFDILENDIKIDIIPANTLLRYAIEVKDPMEIKIK